jgi:hypothetical protein
MMSKHIGDLQTGSLLEEVAKILPVQLLSFFNACCLFHAKSMILIRG